MEYRFSEIEKKWQDEWKNANAYKVGIDPNKEKYYVLDMFPYPSGAGLHVGHPLGYIASDIVARFKRLKGFNVLHPMGYDAFGLPAEQYALENKIHPEVATTQNIANFRSQLDKLGFCYDWDREIKTCDPSYYKWTQWIFLQLFNSWFDRTEQKARPIETLINKFNEHGTEGIESHFPEKRKFTAQAWKGFPKKEQAEILMGYRLAFCGIGEVNWCEALGTVLANDEVVNGVSERGGHPVVKKKLRQWYLRITEYAERLLSGLEGLQWSEAMKEMQSNWIGKSVGGEISFAIEGNESLHLTVYTTRPDTIFGVDFIVVAPEHDIVAAITSDEQKEDVARYLAYVNSRSERERQAEKKISGCFTGACAINPFNNKPIPIWISEYVLAGYGTGAIMAVPCGDDRDFRFAKHFSLPITNILGNDFNGQEANPTKDATLSNSGFLDGTPMRKAMETVMDELEKKGTGKRKINYKMRDAAFSRQRFWGEPFPIVWQNGTAFALPESALPVTLPETESYAQGPEGEGPLANFEAWKKQFADSAHDEAGSINGNSDDLALLETNTMPGYAGSSWYFLRYMDPTNDQAFCGKTASTYWNQVDLYIGGTEHAVGHLLYSRMWTKILHDLGHIGFDEPFKQLLNQGMITGSSRFVFRVQGGGSDGAFVSAGLKDNYQTVPIHVDVNMVDGLELDIEAFKRWRNGEHAAAPFLLEGGKYICGAETEKMSKSKLNTVNPDDLVAKYGADTFRLYEMFLGPVEQSKPWDTKGIEGVHRFLKKLWRLYFDEAKGSIWTKNPPSPAALKTLHKTIKKIEEDTERFSFNTAVSAFMVCVNELTDLDCHEKEILAPLSVLLVPYAPHIAEELWHELGNGGFAIDAPFPKFDPAILVESTKDYPVSINGKVRTNITLGLELDQAAVEAAVLENPTVQKWLEGKSPKKIVYVKNRMINIVV